MGQTRTVGQLAHKTGVPAQTIRYDEQVGVLPAPLRSAAGYRQYAQRDVHRLLFMRRARTLGMSEGFVVDDPAAILGAVMRWSDRGVDVALELVGGAYLPVTIACMPSALTQFRSTTPACSRRIATWSAIGVSGAKVTM